MSRATIFCVSTIMVVLIVTTLCGSGIALLLSTQARLHHSLYFVGAFLLAGGMWLLPDYYNVMRRLVRP